MDKYFICLANSLKRGGRCIAGVEVETDESDHWKVVHSALGLPQWIRPIDANTEFGEISQIDAQPIHLLSVVKLTEVEPCPHDAHAEDVFFLRMEVIGNIQPSYPALSELTDTLHETLFYDSEHAISVARFACGDYSLMLIHARDIHILPDTTKKRAKFRMVFDYLGQSYNMPLTDPLYLQYLEQNTKITTLQEAYLTLSLGMEYEGRHHKLVAGVVLPATKEEANDGLVFRRKREPHWKERETRKLTKEERAIIRSAVFIPSYQGPAAYIRRRNGTDFFLPIEDAPTMMPNQQINLKRILLVTYEDEEGNELQKIRFIPRQHVSIFTKMVEWLER